MGREIRRVPVGFDHPVGETWPGFLNPHHPRRCPDCKNGYSAAAQRYSDEWYGKAPFDPCSTGSKLFGPNHPAVLAFARRNVGHSPAFYGRDEMAVAREARRLAEECLPKSERLARATTPGRSLKFPNPVHRACPCSGLRPAVDGGFAVAHNRSSAPFTGLLDVIASARHRSTAPCPATTTAKSTRT
jgi:hypothetical protein